MNPFSHSSFRGIFGVARRDITPPIGIYSRNWGAADFDVADSMHRPFTLTVLTLQDQMGGKPAAIVAMDLGWWRSPEEIQLLSEAVRSAGVEHFIFAPSHTHAGPIFSPVLKGKPGGDYIRPYLNNIVQAVREAVVDSLRQARPGVWETSHGTCGLASNRDLPDPASGRLLVGWNPGKPADETLLLGRISDDSGKCVATIMNYACHPTILAWENHALSPDFVGAAREVVEDDTGAPCVFLQGASGELAARHQYVGDPEIADRAGRCLGHAALGVFHGMLESEQELVFSGTLESGAPLALWTTRKRTDLPVHASFRQVEIELPLKLDFPTTREIQAHLALESDPVELERLQRSLQRRKLIGEGRSVRREHQIWRFGDILMVSVPDEAYSAMQAGVRKVAGALPVFVVTLATGSNGYLSPCDSFDAGSYASEVSPYERGCFEQTLNFLQSEIQKLL